MSAMTTLYLAAQNDGPTGRLTCRIEVDGVEVSRATSEGAYTIAQCDAVA